MINRPHALYYNGELIAIVLNPDPCPGGITEICDSLSPDEGLVNAVAIPQNMGNLEQWGALSRAIQALGVAETAESTDKERKVVIHVAANDDRYYEIDEIDLIEAAEIPIEENKRMAWLRHRWYPTRVHSDSEVDLVIVPDDYEGWEAFDEYVNELTGV